MFGKPISGSNSIKYKNGIPSISLMGSTYRVHVSLREKSKVTERMKPFLDWIDGLPSLTLSLRHH